MTRAARKASQSNSSEGTQLAKRFEKIDFSVQAIMDRTAERQEQFGKEQRQLRRKENAEALYKLRE